LDRVAIKSLGLISSLGNSEDEILANLDSKIYSGEKQLNYQNVLDGKKTRRMNRFAKLFTNAIQYCVSNSGETLPPDDTGIIANVVYGQINTVLDYGVAVCEEKPELVSPTAFANTVSNAIIGHAAMYFGFKGSSTLLMSSNSVLYSANLIKKEAAKYILACGVEEYCDPVFEYAAQKYHAPLYGEGAVAILLSGQDKSDYGFILGGAQTGLGYSPFLSACKEESALFKKLIQKTLAAAKVTAADIDCVIFGSDRLTGLRGSEEDAVNSIFDNTVKHIYIKDAVGEILGAASAFSVATAATCIRAGKYRRILVSNIEATGTLEAFVIGQA
jgi:3-oxoacyl-(acyl-carrier-protein) synthase